MIKKRDLTILELKLENEEKCGKWKPSFSALLLNKSMKRFDSTICKNYNFEIYPNLIQVIKVLFEKEFFPGNAFKSWKNYEILL